MPDNETPSTGKDAQAQPASMPRIDAGARSVCGIRMPGSRCICGVANRCERVPEGDGR